jgi:hypothetical protein
MKFVMVYFSLLFFYVLFPSPTSRKTFQITQTSVMSRSYKLIYFLRIWYQTTGRPGIIRHNEFSQSAQHPYKSAADTEPSI